MDPDFSDAGSGVYTLLHHSQQEFKQGILQKLVHFVKTKCSWSTALRLDITNPWIYSADDFSEYFQSVFDRTVSSRQVLLKGPAKFSTKDISISTEKKSITYHLM